MENLKGQRPLKRIQASDKPRIGLVKQDSKGPKVKGIKIVLY